MDTAEIDLTIRKGATFGQTLRWGQSDLEYREIQAVEKKAPCVLHVPDHGVPDGWVVQIEGAHGVRGLNTDRWVQAQKRDKDSLEINSINAATLRGRYRGNGHVVYHKPVDLSGFMGRMQVREHIHAEKPLLSLDSDTGGVSLDTDTAEVRINIPATDTAAIDWREGVYDLELESLTGDVYALARGYVEVIEEVTR